MAIADCHSDNRVEFQNLADLKAALLGRVKVNEDGVTTVAPLAEGDPFIDQLAFSAVFSEQETKAAARWLIRALSAERGIYPASIHELYMAAGTGKYTNSTAPAINVRGLTYDMAQTIFRAAQREQAGIVIFEIARSELGYSDQRPGDFAAAVLAAAIAVDWRGPVFIQGDHFQVNAKAYGQDAAAELQRLRDLTVEAIDAGFYNIDIDASTLVELDLPDLAAQQRLNYTITSELTQFIREREPAGVTVSIGGEIGEVGARNSTVADLDAFMTGYVADLARRSREAGRSLPGISKISVQTGTSHGGVVLPDGTIADVAVDFNTLAELSRVARDSYGMGGAVQHGASTLPEVAFGHFAAANAIEVHLATLFQNILYDHPQFPADLKAAIYAHLAEHFPGERKPGQTDAQFYYTTRKRGYGPFKRELWDLPAGNRVAILQDLEDTYALLMKRLGVSGTRDLVDQTITPVMTLPVMPPGLRGVALS